MRNSKSSKGASIIQGCTAEEIILRVERQVQAQEKKDMSIVPTFTPEEIAFHEARLAQEKKDEAKRKRDLRLAKKVKLKNEAHIIRDYIYAIVLQSDLDAVDDPLDCIRRYVGRSENPERRWKEHARFTKQRYGTTYIELHKLCEQHETDIAFIILEEVKKKVHSREYFWVEESLEDNHPLLNTKPGDSCFTTSSI